MNDWYDCPKARGKMKLPVKFHSLLICEGCNHKNKQLISKIENNLNIACDYEKNSTEKK